jgi:hypothetical protein
VLLSVQYVVARSVYDSWNGGLRDVWVRHRLSGQAGWHHDWNHCCDEADGLGRTAVEKVRMYVMYIEVVYTTGL